MWKTLDYSINITLMEFVEMWKNVFSTFTMNLHRRFMLFYTHLLGVSLCLLFIRKAIFRNSNHFKTHCLKQSKTIKSSIL